MISLLIFLGVIFVKPTYAQLMPEFVRQEAKIIKIISQEERSTAGTAHTYQLLSLLVTSDTQDEGQMIEIESGLLPMANNIEYKVGDRLIVESGLDFEGQKMHQIVDYKRYTSVYGLVAIFVFLVIILAGIYGFRSILSLSLSFVLIFTFLIPRIIEGQNPFFITFVFALFAIPATFYISHGFSKQTHISVLASLITLLLTIALGSLAIELTRLTGFSSEDSLILKSELGNAINIKALLLPGIVLAAVGVLDDITISQSNIAFEIFDANPNLSFKEIFSKTTTIGRHHIASMVNTLVLIYAGESTIASLLFVKNKLSLSQIFNLEFIAEEVIRTITISIGLMLAVPLTTAFSCLYLTRSSHSK